MIRVKISIGIVAAIIILGISGFFLLRHETDEVIYNIEKTRTLVKEEKINEALDSADVLVNDWNKFHKYASIFVNNDKISAAQNSISRIKSLIENGSDEINAELDTASSALKWIVESEIPRWTNIL